MKALISLREALADDNLLGQAITGESWAIWRALLLASRGEALTVEERELFRLVTDRDHEPDEPVEEFWAIAGRRSGKTRAAAVLGSYLATCIDWTDCLARGERASLPVLASNTSQASRVFEHIIGVLQYSPNLSELLEGEPTAECIKLSTQVDISIKPANFRTIRGVTAIAVIGDELAFWQIEGSRNPDKEILNAARPAMATTGGPLIVISSPYARRGELYATFKLDYGPNGDPAVLVAKGASKTFNSELSQKTVDRAFRRDAASAIAEYGGEFRTDVEVFVTREIVDACVTPGLSERPAVSGIKYVAFVDPSGGSADSMTLAIAHENANTAVLDVVLEQKPPFSPKAVVANFAAVLKEYGITRILGDRYAGEWPREVFRSHGIIYEPAARPKSDLYRDLLPLLNSGRVELLENERLITQIVGLERRTGRGGKDSIDHAPGAHDDLVNSVSGALIECVPTFFGAGSGLFELMRQEAEAQQKLEPTKPDLPEYAPGSVEYASGQRRMLPTLASNPEGYNS
ncbi:hypothetical protein [Phyllobacterium sp. 628]|uniref:hypothetical protein n=1 Tax=Phyllobacterium sp. 628 TaxID=2718938 RepID=UPI0016627AB2|nr:hypothetical protein [Phyllobacterium sp. 628]